jgi:co-chaperonin GroES (HSP10)
MNPIVGEIKAIHDQVFVIDMNFGEQKTSTGIVLLSDDGKSEGVKPRWAKVHAIGPKQTDIKIGEWILIEHGRWTRGFNLKNNNGEEQVIRRVDVTGIMVVSETRPTGLEMGSYVTPTSPGLSDFAV